MSTIRRFLALEAIVFGLAALVHFGVLLSGYEHRRASIAETVIGVVLLLAWIAALARPGWTRGAGIAAQGFALLGTLVGVTMVAIGVGPRTVPDVVYHVAVVCLLAWGLAATLRRNPPAR